MSELNEYEMNLGFTFYPKDWWSSDAYFDLCFEERYIYLECLFIMYLNDGFLDKNTERINKRLRYEISDEQWANVTSKFIEIDGKYTCKSVNKRLRKTIANRENGKKGGRPKKPKKPSLETQKNPPLEKESKKKVKINTGEFELFWDAYGKKINRARCESLWAKIPEEERAKILDHAPKYAASREKKYRKDPERYLKNESWKDEIIGETKSKKQLTL